MNEHMGIPAHIPQIQEEDIPELAKTAEHEANPLYPVPVLWTRKQLEEVYFSLKNQEKEWDKINSIK